MLTTVRVQEKGQVTLPKDIRKKLRLKKGDLVTFVIENNNVLIKPVSTAAQELLDQLEKNLVPRGVALGAVLEACQREGGEAAARNFSLSFEEKATLFLALQLQAQQALESIRLQAERAGLNQLSEEEINAEIQAANMLLYLRARD